MQVAYGSAFAHFPGQTSHDMLIPPSYASVSVEEICQPQFEDLELDIPRDDGERTLKDTVHGIILWPKRYIIIPQTNPPQSRPSSSPRSSSRPSISPRSPSTQEPLFNSGGAISSRDIDINPESPPKKQKKPMAAKKAPSKAEKTSQHHRKNLPDTKAYQKKPRNHRRRNHSKRNHHRKNHLATKAQPKKPSEHNLPTQCNHQNHQRKKMVEPISKRKLAWETIEKEGKTTIGAQHVHEFFINLNTKQQQRG
jgi:hypothetical protein